MAKGTEAWHRSAISWPRTAREDKKKLLPSDQDPEQAAQEKDTEDAWPLFSLAKGLAGTLPNPELDTPPPFTGLLGTPGQLAATTAPAPLYSCSQTTSPHWLPEALAFVKICFLLFKSRHHY